MKVDPRSYEKFKMMKITGRTITVFSYKKFAVKKTTPEKNFQAKFVSVFHLLGVIG